MRRIDERYSLFRGFKILVRHALKLVSGDGRNRDTISSFEFSATSGNAADTARSASHPKDNSITLCLNFFPEFIIIVHEHIAGFPLAYRGD